MLDAKVNAYFVSEKISKIRWLPEELKATECFITGSWDMPTNYLRLWRFKENVYTNKFNNLNPVCRDKIKFKSNISGLELLTNDTVAVGSTDGDLSIVNIKHAIDSDTLKLEARSQILHKFETSAVAACTGISVFGKEIATVGEDGRLNIIDVENVNNVVRSTKTGELSLTTVTYISPKEIMVGNRMGLISLFDARAGEPVLSKNFMISCADERYSNYVSCITTHPTQSYIVLCGSEEGSITVWDLRNPDYPASYLSAHTSTINEIKFHRTDPSNVFTAAESGELWMWSEMSTLGALEYRKEERINVWLNGERAKSRINLVSLVSNVNKSMNSIDSCEGKVICGSDNEAIYLVDNIF